MRVVLLFLAGCLLAGCATGPRPPLLAPLGTGAAWGYGERSLGGDRWEVTYVGPLWHSAPVQGAAGEAGARAQASDLAAWRAAQVSDLAAWRAAQVAQAHGFAAFKAVDTRSNIDSRVEDYVGMWGAGWGYRSRGWWGPPPFPNPPPTAWVRATVTMVVQMKPAVEPGDTDAADLIRRMQQAYPGAEEPSGSAR